MVGKVERRRTEEVHRPGDGTKYAGPDRPCRGTREAARREQEFLERQAYRLRLARDSLVRELTHVGGRRPPGTSAGDLENVLTSKLELRLLRTLRALEKIEEGTYGLCDSTGEPIARSRLEQVPEEIESPRGRRLLRTAGR